MALEKVGIVGAGAWGTALAVTAKRAGCEAVLWAFEAEVADEINRAHRNSVYLPDIPLDPGIRATQALKEIAGCDLILLVAPAQYMRAMATKLAFHLSAGQMLVIAAKGIEQESGKLLSEVVAEVAPGAQIGVISGPGFASEIARGLPSAVTLAMADETMGRALAHRLSHPLFRCYWSEDVIGAQVGGAVKNVLAIAAGIVVGKKLGASAHAATVTRGFAEMARLGTALGARRETMTGLSGLGDLVLTCGSPQSRNMSLGLGLGEGTPIDEILASRRSVTEGIFTAGAVVELAAAKGVGMPICHAVHAVVAGQQSVDEVIVALLSRPLRPED